MLRFIALFLLPWVVIAPACADIHLFKKDKITIHSTGHDYPITVEIAETPKQQEQGLMHRTTLAQDHGMLFILPNDRMVSMWMKDTEIPLDMLFIDKTGTITYIEENAAPNSTRTIRAKNLSRAVLEMKGGSAKKLGLRAGDRIVHPYFHE